MNESTQNLPAKNETDYIAAAASEDAGFDKLLKFKKGLYYLDGVHIPLGTKYIAHVVGWTRCWVKFRDKQLVERRVFRVSLGERAPDRDLLDDNDPSKWEPGPNGQPSDPWVFQQLLPMEDENSGDVAVFVSSSFGGKRAVGDLASIYSKRVMRGLSGQPKVELQTAMMPTSGYGDVIRPWFKVYDWTNGVAAVRDVTPPAHAARGDMDDEIPF